MKIFAAVVLLALLAGCGANGLMIVEKDGSVHGKTYDINKLRAMSIANQRKEYADDPSKFGYKNPHDPTDIRRTNNRNQDTKIERSDGSGGSGGGQQSEHNQKYQANKEESDASLAEARRQKDEREGKK